MHGYKNKVTLFPLIVGMLSVALSLPLIIYGVMETHIDFHCSWSFSWCFIEVSNGGCIRNTSFFSFSFSFSF